MKKKVFIIGSGFSSLSAACYLSKNNFEVHVFEKNKNLGGRACQFKAEGFTFDMGPSWYWMPDVFERFFNDFGKNRSDFYSLDKLNPGYRVVFDKESQIQIGDSIDKIAIEFEKIEKGSGLKLKNFIKKRFHNLSQLRVFMVKMFKENGFLYRKLDYMYLVEEPHTPVQFS